jgi:hypothetical protein
MARKSTSRHIRKRIDNKRVRSAEAAALRGGPIKTVRTDSWAARDDRQPPILDHPSNGKSRKKEKKKISYCPAREGHKRHAYLTGEEEVMAYPWPPRKPYLVTREYKMCVYCGKNGRANRRHFKHYHWYKSSRRVNVV